MKTKMKTFLKALVPGLILGMFFGLILLVDGEPVAGLILMLVVFLFLGIFFAPEFSKLIEQVDKKYKKAKKSGKSESRKRSEEYPGDEDTIDGECKIIQDNIELTGN